MAAMMAPPPAATSSFLLVPHPMQHQRPASILLNGHSSSPASSAQNSPRRPSYFLPVPPSAFSTIGENRRSTPGPSSISSHSSSSSSSSDDITSSSAQSGTDSLSNSLSRAGARKIRFAPLPDPRREVFVAEDGSEIPASEVFADGPSQEACVPALTMPCSPAAANTPTPMSSGFPNNSTSLLHPGSSVGSLGLYGDDSLSISGQSVSTVTGGGSATYLPLEKLNSRNSGSASAPSSPKRNRWSRLLRLPKKTSVTKLTPDFSGSLFRTNSHDSSNSTIDDYAEKKSSPMDRRQSTGSVGFSGQESRNAFKMGLPLTPVVSESGTSSTRPSTAPSSHSPFGSKLPARRGTRLLNGRVYGYSGARSGNPFKNVKDQEPEFVEWGHGGMGSIHANSGHGSEWARLQSNKKLSVGHAEGQNEGDGDDDGSGMGWVKRRREQREKERKEREAKEKAEGLEGKGDAVGTEARIGAVETPSITIRSASPLTGVGEDDSRGGDRVEESASANAGTTAKSVAETSSTTPAQTKEGSTQPTEAAPEHVYTAVTLPAHLPKHHHRDQVHRSASAGSSHVSTPVTEHPSANILAGTSSSSSSATMLPFGAAGTPSRSSPLADSSITIETASLVSPGALSVSSSSSTEDSDSEDEVEREDDEDEDEDDEVLDEAEEEARKTALSAGVEKVSKHKD
ncbi:hypothetical protein SCHPADRAFT_885326 [Schizopora paradoxa]|uniref:Uncharacterized protein n=1 Tax=Schizopora paradoxa TaxID=27342 RepID=A0A0H2S680_9AGAM|nr:hypothetical protein SCHPADRAFT_885326 [Schizopora paradoxa]